MSTTVKVLAAAALTVIHAACAVWVYRDVRRRGGNAVGWCFAACFYGILAGLLYLLGRSAGRGAETANAGPAVSFSPAELKRYEWYGLAAAAVGLAVAGASWVIKSRGVIAPEYAEGYRGAGWIALVTGLVWTGLSFTRRKTDFFSTAGRFSRTELMSQAGVVAAATIFLGITAALLLNRLDNLHERLAWLAGWTIAIVGAVLLAFPHVKRLHDLGRSGLEAWFLVVPLYNLYWLFLLWTTKGENGPNAYGPDPLRVR